MSIRSTLYPNASVSKAGTVSENNGSRSPVTKVNNGDAVVFIVKNGLNSSYGGNWLVTVSIALTSEAARISAPGTGENTTQHVIDGVTYWVALQATNATYGHGTEVINPLGLPVLQDYYICDVNSSPTTARVAQIISDLGITTQSSEVSGSVYIGNNSNTPSKVIALHIGDTDNRPRKIIKGWIGDSDNKPRLFWGGGKTNYILPDYTPQQTYTLNATWDVEDFITDAINKWVKKNENYTQSPEIFSQISANMATIVSYLSSFKGNRTGVAIKFETAIAYQKLWMLTIRVQYVNTPMSLLITNKQTVSGKTYYTTQPFVAAAFIGEPSYDVVIHMGGLPIDYTSTSTGTNVNNIGYRYEYFTTYGFYDLTATNVGMVKE